MGAISILFENFWWIAKVSQASLTLEAKNKVFLEKIGQQFFAHKLICVLPKWTNNPKFLTFSIRLISLLLIVVCEHGNKRGMHRNLKVCKERAHVHSEYVFTKLCQEYNYYSKELTSRFRQNMAIWARPMHAYPQLETSARPGKLRMNDPIVNITC